MDSLGFGIFFFGATYEGLDITLDNARLRDNKGWHVSFFVILNKKYEN